MPNAKRLVLLLIVFSLVLPLMPVAEAAPPSCNTEDGQVHQMPMQSSSQGECTGTLLAQVGDVAYIAWDTWRGWDLKVHVDLSIPSHVRVTRLLPTSTLETKEGTGPFDFEKDLPLPFANSYDLEVREVIKIELVAGGLTGFTVRVTRIAPTDADCNERDTSAGNPIVLSSGVKCDGHFVDGWRAGGTRTTWPPQPDDAYRVNNVTDGDVVDVYWNISGHSFDITYKEGAATLGVAKMRPAAGVTAFTNYRYAKVGDGSVSFTVGVVYPNVRSHVECGEMYCETVIDGIEDFMSFGPFDYNVKAIVRPNDRPTVVVDIPPPRFVFDGDKFHAYEHIIDPDGDNVTPSMSVTGGSAVSITYTPTQGVSGEGFFMETGAILGAGTRTVTLGGADKWGVPAFAGTLTQALTVYPADCAAGASDAPASGRAFSSKCAGFLHRADDTRDLLLYNVGAGKQTTIVLASVSGTITSPNGTVDVVPFGGTYVDYSPIAGAYRIALDASPDFPDGQTYTVTASSTSVTPPTGSVTLALASATNADGSVTRNTSIAARVTSDDARSRNATAALSWGDGSPTENFAAPWRVAQTRTHSFASPGEYLVNVVATADNRSSTASLPLTVRLPNDCGIIGDAPPEGRPITASCVGYLASDDPTDTLTFAVAAGKHLIVNASGAALSVLAPDNSNVPIVNGVAHDWSGNGGTWTIQLDALPGTTTDKPYFVNATSVTAPAPSGAVLGAIPEEWPATAPFLPNLVATDLRYADVAMTVNWGDGATQRIPASGWLPSGTVSPTTHAYATPGIYQVVATADARTGAALAPLVRTVNVVPASDCGAADAPNTNNGAAVALPDGRCWGILLTNDPADYYQVRVDPLALPSFIVRVCTFAPLGATATLYVLTPGGVGLTQAPLTTSSTSGGCTTLANGTPAVSSQYLVRVARTSGEGAYSVELTRS